MLSIPPEQILLLMALTLFVIGLLTFLAGMFILLARSNNREIQAITSQASSLVKKGLAEDFAGLIGNTTSLLSAMSELTRTQAGTGTVLVITGLLMMLSGCFLTWYLFHGSLSQ
jgi:hypothetical protein